MHYESDTGVFTWIKKSCLASRITIGDIAGWIEVQGYRCIEINGDFYKLHRLTFLYMIGRLPINQIDHINHIRNDNRWCNLREVTHKENCKNRLITKNI